VAGDPAEEVSEPCARQAEPEERGESVNEVGASEEFDLRSVPALRPKLMVTLDRVEA
jgi:hypothetical protein